MRDVKLTGKNLLMVKRAVALAICEVHNMIATCPDVVVYADEIEEHKAEKLRLERMHDRIEKAIVKEGK